MACILLHDMMVQECINSESDPFESFCDMILMNVVTMIITMMVIMLMMMLHFMYTMLRQKFIIKCKS